MQTAGGEQSGEKGVGKGRVQGEEGGERSPILAVTKCLMFSCRGDQ